MANGGTSKVGVGGGGLGDILSMALRQTGVESMTSPQISLDSSSILNAAANTLDPSLLSSDIGVLTRGLFSTLAIVRDSPSKPSLAASGRTSCSIADVTPADIATTYSIPLAAPLLEMTCSTGSESAKAAAFDRNKQDALSKPSSSPVAELPSTSESERPGGDEAQLVKLQTQNSCMDDDIDLDELLSVGDNVNANISHISLLDMEVGPSGDVSTFPSATPVSFDPQSFSAASTGHAGGSGAAASSAGEDDDLSSLLNMAGSQYLESLDPDFIGGGGGQQDELAGKSSLGTSSSLQVPPSGSVTVAVSLADLLTPVPGASSNGFRNSSSSLPAKTTTSSTPLLLPTTSPSPVTPSPSSSPANVPKSTTTAAATTTTPAVVPTTKLDVAAILREVARLAPALTTASTASITNTVSVTVVPSSALANAIRASGLLRPQARVSLPGGVPLVTRAPLALTGQRYMSGMQTVCVFQVCA